MKTDTLVNQRVDNPIQKSVQPRNDGDGGWIATIFIITVFFSIGISFLIGQVSVINADDYLNRQDDYVVDTTIVHSANGVKTLKFHVKSKKSMAY